MLAVLLEGTKTRESCYARLHYASYISFNAIGNFSDISTNNSLNTAIVLVKRYSNDEVLSVWLCLGKPYRIPPHLVDAPMTAKGKKRKRKDPVSKQPPLDSLWEFCRKTCT